VSLPVNCVTWKDLEHTGMRCIVTFQSTTDRIYDGGPTRLCYYNI